MGLDLIPLNFPLRCWRGSDPLNVPLGCGPGPDPPQFPPWVWAWRGGLLLGGISFWGSPWQRDLLGGVSLAGGCLLPGGPPGRGGLLGGYLLPGGAVSQHALTGWPRSSRDEIPCVFPVFDNFPCVIFK